MEPDKYTFTQIKIAYEVFDDYFDYDLPYSDLCKKLLIYFDSLEEALECRIESPVPANNRIVFGTFLSYLNTNPPNKIMKKPFKVKPMSSPNNKINYQKVKYKKTNVNI